MLVTDCKDLSLIFQKFSYQNKVMHTLPYKVAKLKADPVSAVQIMEVGRHRERGFLESDAGFRI